MKTILKIMSVSLCVFLFAAMAAAQPRGIMYRLTILENRVYALEDQVAELQDTIDNLSWEPMFDTRYWRAATPADDMGGGVGSWNAGLNRWESGQGEWYEYYPDESCSLIAVGTWVEGYRPTRVRIILEPPTSASTYIFAMFDADQNVIAESPWHCNGGGCFEDGFVSGDEFDITWLDDDLLFLGVMNLFEWTLVEDPDGNPYWDVVPAEPFAIVNIEFLP